MRKMKALRHKMDDKEVTQRELAEWIGKSLDYVNKRMTEKEPFNIWEAYIICEKLHIPAQKMYQYFPTKGR